ncbi:uncharacterized protein EV154DRAFT_489134 [Mucor mucedo]|uniref:uncharacterized protein n=1 Tax=Mucor mucedo TaxID=29922 RepID=UPI00221EC405|nr:uncharacterized protein EV154DRAFT_489134 [Mucor mucedo]KAI7862967.1 hypothetical protein EV154DRAFT_489134 [Mucor mucedo]
MYASSDTTDLLQKRVPLVPLLYDSHWITYFQDMSPFDINIKPLTARSTRGTPDNVTSPSARAVSHTILRAISTCEVVNLEIRLPLTPKRIKAVGPQKRKATAFRTKATERANADH